MHCPKCKNEGLKYIPPEAPTDHDPGEPGHYHCQFCGWDDYCNGMAEEIEESRKADWECDRAREKEAGI